MPLNISGSIVNAGIASTLNYKSIITRGLTFYLEAGDPGSYPQTGTTWFDVSGNNHIGTLTNGPTFSSNNGGTIVFDGTNDFVDLTNASTPLSNLSYETILKIDSIPASNVFRSIWQKSDNWNESTGISLQMIYGSLTFSYGSPWGGSVSYALSNLTVGNWYHIVGTSSSVSSGTSRMYINGSLVATGANEATPTTTSNLTLGLGNGGNFLGNISVFRTYNRQLADAEVVQNYNAQRGRFGV
jgi:hypothetical protein